MRTKFAALPFLVFAGVVAAQTPTATLVGRITDASRAGVASAGIRIRHVDTNETRTAQSQPDGEYTISSLPPGMYEVIIDKPGFKELRESNLELQVGQTARIDAQLEVGAVTQSVEIRA